MKKKILLLALLMSGFMIGKAGAQISFSLKINIATQPVWGPTGYDHVEYYYMPDIHVFYYVPRQQYFYQQNGRWISRSSLPARYHDYDIYTSYKVVVNEPAPYRDAESYRVKYAGYKNRHDQTIIRDSRDEKYYENKKHPEYYRWRQEHLRNRRNDNRNRRS